MDSLRLFIYNCAAKEGRISTLHDYFSSANDREKEAHASLESVKGQLDAKLHSFQVSKVSFDELFDATKRALLVVNVIPRSLEERFLPSRRIFAT